MLRGTFLTLFVLGALSLGALGADGVFAHNARNAAAIQESAPTKAPLEPVQVCPQSIEVGATPWRGRVLAPVGAKPRTLCGATGAWSFFRLHPRFQTGLSTADILIEWDSLNPMHVAVGWGSCFSDARICLPRPGAQPDAQSQARFPDWPEGAPLWVAVLDPEAPGEAPKQGDGRDGDSTKAENGKDKSGTGQPATGESGTDTASGEPAGQRFSLGWRVFETPKR